MDTFYNMRKNNGYFINNYNNYFQDLYYDLVGAKHLITITGWSVWTGLT